MNRSRLRHGLAAAALAAVSLAGSGCYSVSKACDTVPASRLDRHFLGDVRENLCPVPLTALGQEKPVDHRIGEGDVLSVYIYGVLPPSVDETPIVPRVQNVNQRYYPPRGSDVAPATGVPVTVGGDGTLSLPLIDPIDVRGMTMAEARDSIKDAYSETDVVKKGRERITLTLVTPRVKRIMVVREDTPNPNVELLPPGQVDHIHRGSGEVIDLPAYENDVLHALTFTGGLPGTDAAREVWVFRQNGVLNPTTFCGPQCGTVLASYTENPVSAGAIRIPLAGQPGEALPFSQADVVLQEGDVVFVPRREEFFYTGGLLGGAQIPLPRDRDIDVLEAIALAAGSTGGPLAQSGQALANGTPGYVANASRAIVLREMPDGRQLAIRVDLDRAKTDAKERIFIKPNDIVTVQMKPGQKALNTVLNIFNFSFLVNDLGD